MPVITVFNNKGGVGKTTLLCNLASFLALRMKKRVLLIDADPQCNATAYLLPEANVLSLYTSRKHLTVDSYMDPLRRGKGYLSESVPLITSPRFGVDLLPGDPRFALSEDLLASDWKAGAAGDPRGLQTTYVFADIVQRYADYDFVFCDVGPALGAINRSVLLASEYFLVAMASDIFSLMAIGNIALSLNRWKAGIEIGLTNYKAEEGEPFCVRDVETSWRLKFVGYVRQQYTAKTVQGRRQPVRAYDRILKQAPDKIEADLVANFPTGHADFTSLLGEIPNLHSVVPLSQSANAPIFDLKNRDGVVGAHFAKVTEAEAIFSAIVTRLIENLGVAP
jgi:cellulose biosynthesis protein BcsQ